MNYQAILLSSEHVPFVASIFSKNIAVLHSKPISIGEWYRCLCEVVDSDEKHFIITANGNNAAWLKLNGLDGEDIYISMLVVATEYQRQGVGAYAIRVAEEYARRVGKNALKLCTTQDNTDAIAFYKAQGFEITRSICYTVGDAILQDGYEFQKVWEAKT